MYNLSFALALATGLTGATPPNAMLPGQGPVVITELRVNQPGSDNDEFFELSGAPGTPLDGLSFVILSAEGDAGRVEFVHSLIGQSVQADGVFAFGDSTLDTGTLDQTGSFDPSGNPATYLVVQNAFLEVGDDLDLDDDGRLDVLPFDAVVDAVGLVDGDADPDMLYATSAVVGPDGNFGPGHVWRADQGGFQLGSFSSLGADTPGAPNPMAGPALDLVSAVQGPTPADGDASNDGSPMLGQTVTVQGIVIADFQAGEGDDGDLGGFYLQEEDIDADADPSTSEAVFVASERLEVRVGDRVEVRGLVAETEGRTEIGTPDQLSLIAVAQALPTPARVDLPAAAFILSDSGERYPDFEAFEGMRVRFPQALTVTELYQLDDAGLVRLAQGGRFFAHTHTSTPSVAGYQRHLEDLAVRTVVLDDGFVTPNPIPTRFPAGGISARNPLRIGDAVGGLTGVLHALEDGSAHRVMATQTPNFVSTNPRPEAPVVGGSLKVASFNVLNYFDTLADGSGACYRLGANAPGNCRGAGSAEELARQTDKLVTALAELDAGIYGLLELENDGNEGGTSAIADLARALSARGTRSCQGDFAWVDPRSRVGDDAIATGIIYCPSLVARAPGTRPAVLTDAALAPLGVDTSTAIFSGSNTSRASLAASFVDRSTQGVFTVVINHFKSKSGSGLGDDADQMDGAGAYNGTRTRSAQALAQWVASDPTGAGTQDALLIGDFNAYTNEAPIAALEAAGYVALASGEYSYVFDGQAGTLDHAFASPSLVPQVMGAEVWHLNADEADALDYNLDGDRPAGWFSAADPYRSSDHDAVVVGLTVAPIQISTVLGEDFSSGDSGSFVATSSASSANWAFANDQSGTSDDRPAMRINGFGADEASRDWLVSPNVDVPAVGATTLSFETFVAYDGGRFEAYVLEGYVGDTETATRTQLSFNRPADNSRVWTPSGPIDLGAWAGRSIRIAFLYTSTGTGGGDGADWSVTNIRIENFRGLRVGLTASADTVRAGETVSFTGSAQGGAEPYSYAWDFGDGSNGTGAVVQHIYGVAGTFTSTLTVTDADGAQRKIKKETRVIAPSDDTVPAPAGDLRVATFNASLNRMAAGELVAELATSTTSPQARQIAEIIQRVRPDVVLLNEFDFDDAGQAALRFHDNYLRVSQNGADPLDYGYVFTSTVNTGTPSGVDLDGNGTVGGPGDAFGFGDFSGQYGMVIYSRFPIDEAAIRSFQTFLWKDMPGAHLPQLPGEGPGAGSSYYSEAALNVFRLSSKAHWDVPVDVDGTTVHILAAHPTPPVFDDGTRSPGEAIDAIDWNGLRNHDEIRLWADYVTPGRGDYIYDDDGQSGGLGAGERFVIVGDYNADPYDGDSTFGAALQLTNHPAIDNRFVPTSRGGVQQSEIQGEANAEHRGQAAFDTSDFSEPPGNLRVDYVLGSAFGLDPVAGGVFWPLESNPAYDLVEASDHRLVYMDFGLDSVGTLVRSSEEAAGANCEFGGVRLESGRDLNGNGAVDDDEVESTRFICDGRDGNNGTNGRNGENGDDGQAGPQGPQGPQGPEGRDGIDGKDGEDGESGAAGPFLLLAGLGLLALRRREDG